MTGCAGLKELVRIEVLDEPITLNFKTGAVGERHIVGFNVPRKYRKGIGGRVLLFSFCPCCGATMKDGEPTCGEESPDGC